MKVDPREWTDEQTAIAVAVTVIAIVSIAGSLTEIPFGSRTVIAVAAGVVAMVITSYLLTGALLPPDETQTERS